MAIVNPYRFAVSGGFSPEAEAVFARMTGLTDSEKNIMATFIDAQVLNGNWALVDEYFNFHLQTSGNSLTGWLNKTATLSGSPTHDPSYGFRTDGSSNYINTNFNPSVDAVRSSPGDVVYSFQLNDQDTNFTTSNVYVFGANGGGTQTQFQLASVTNRFRTYSDRNYSQTLQDDWRVASYHAMLWSFRNPTDIRAELYKDNVQRGINTNLGGTQALTNREIYIGASNIVGSASGFHAVDIGSLGILGGGGTSGSNFDRDGWYNEEITMINALKAL